MHVLTQHQFEVLLRDAGIRSRLQKEVRFGASLPTDWAETELLGVPDRSKNKGVLLMQPDDQIFVVSYELSGRLTNQQTGRSKPITCDFCYTWQNGGNATMISFPRPDSATRVGFLCCADLRCSEHVRTLTQAALLSRTQLHEDLDDAQRVERLRRKLRELVDNLQLKPLSPPEAEE